MENPTRQMDDGDPVVLASAAGRGVHHFFNGERRSTFCGYRVRHEDIPGTQGLPACLSCRRADPKRGYAHGCK